MKNFILFLNLFIVFTVFSKAQTVLEKGDLLIVGVNYNASCITYQNLTLSDEIYLVALKDLAGGTQLDITDNGYSRQFSNYFGGTEGRISFILKNDINIPKGKVFKLRFVGNTGGKTAFKTNMERINPDWNLGIDSSSQYYHIDISSQDQIFILQQGTWSSNNNFTGNHNFQYSGNLITAFNLRNIWNPLSNSTNDSELPSIIANMDVRNYHYTSLTNSNTPNNFYIGNTTLASKTEWLIRLLNPNNWSNNTCQNINNNNYQNFQIIEEYEDSVCINDEVSFTIPLDSQTASQSIQTGFQWYISTSPTNIGGTPINGQNTRSLSYTPSTSGTYYFYCNITYRLKWRDSNGEKSSSNTLPSAYYKVTVNENTTSPILNIP